MLRCAEGQTNLTWRSICRITPLTVSKWRALRHAPTRRLARRAEAGCATQDIGRRRRTRRDGDSGDHTVGRHAPEHSLDGGSEWAQAHRDQPHLARILCAAHRSQTLKRSKESAVRQEGYETSSLVHEHARSGASLVHRREVADPGSGSLAAMGQVERALTYARHAPCSQPST